MTPNENKTLLFFRNRRITRRIAQLDPVRDHVEIVRLLGCYEFPYDTVRALEIALFSTFASPAISKLLDRTGEFRDHGQRRYDDTAILITEFLIDGYDGPIGKRAIEQMNKLHGSYKIDNEDFVFVLSTFVFQPIDWFAQFGWRPMTPGEQQALYLFWVQVGLRMKLHDIPESLEAFRAWEQDYRKRHFFFAQTNRNVADATVRIVENWLPRFLRPCVFPVMNALLEPDVREAFHYPNPNRLLRGLVRGSLWIRKQFLKIITFQQTPRTTHNTHYRTYPNHEYELETIGPPRLVKQIKE